MKNIFYIIHSNSFGDTLASTPTLRYLFKCHKQKINVVTHNKNVFKNNPYVEELFSFDEFVGQTGDNILKYESFTFPGQIDRNGIEKKFSHIDTRLLHSMDLGFQLLPEDMSYDFYPDPLELKVNLPEKYVVLHTTTNWPNRTWDKENWQKLINWLSDNKIFTVLIGAGYKEKLHESLSDQPLEKVCPHFENLYGIDLTNQGSISDMWWVINNSELIVTMDSGPLHVAGCTDTRIIQLGSAINPKFRAPFRNGSQDYKYHFVGGTCEIFCNSNLLYNVQHWGDINHIPPQPGCLENKPTFECHPSLNQIISLIEKYVNQEVSTKSKEVIEFLPLDSEDKLKYNFMYTSDDIITMVVRDVTTGLYRDRMTQKCERLSEGYYWWAPMPGKILNLGDIDLYIYLNDNLIDVKRFYINGGKNLQIGKTELYFDNLKGNEYPTFWEIFINNDYNKIDNCLVEPGDVVLDIGANVGFFTLDSIQKRASKVYSIEPHIDSFNQVKFLSEKFENIIPINKAVSKSNDVVEMFIDENASATNCMTEYGEIFNRNSNVVKIQSVNINTLIEEIGNRLDFVKIDCEGCEYDIFKTITSSNLKSISKFVIETHSDEIDEFIFTKLIDHNFKVYKFDNILYAIKY
jgi:FkbM family methyltransferase